MRSELLKWEFQNLIIEMAIATHLSDFGLSLNNMSIPQDDVKVGST